MRELSLIAIAGCMSSSGPIGSGPRGLRADEHLEVARENDVIANDHRSWPAPILMTPGELDAMPKIIPLPVRPSAEHEDIARVHRGEAAGLQAGYEAACGQRPAAEVTVSPLARYQIGGYNTDRGVVVLLDAAAPASEEVVALMECHRAWLMLESREVEDPLDVPGLHVEARDVREGVTVALTPVDPQWIPELQRRVAVQLEGRRSERPSSPEASGNHRR